MASSSESGGGSGIETIFRKELKTLPVDSTIRRSSKEEAREDDQAPSTLSTEEKAFREGVSSSEEFELGLESFFSQQEKDSAEGVVTSTTTKGGEEYIDPSGPSKETIFRKELKSLIVGSTSRRDSQEMTIIDNQGPSNDKMEEVFDFIGITSTGEVVMETSVQNQQEKVKIPDEGNSLPSAEVCVADISVTNKETIYRKELKNLKVHASDNVQEETEVLVQGLSFQEAVVGKSEFKGVSSTVGSVTELKSVAISQDRLKSLETAALLTRTEPETIHEEELALVLETVKEGQVHDGALVSREVKEARKKSKSLSTGSIEIKAKAPAVGELGSSFDRTRKRSHVPLTVLERMEKDPIVAQHFAQLESPTAETVSEFADGSKRLLSTTSRLRRTTDSVGLKYVNQYIVIKVLGCGTYGKGAMREIAIMKKLNHPNIVALHEVIDDPSKRKLYLVLEYIEGGPILGNDKWRPFPEEKARSFFRDMCKGIDYLHFNKVVHRDLKPGNLLQTLDGKIKISDFGVSHMFEQESDSMHDTAGTPAFLAPEICSGGQCQGRPADLWSLGVPLSTTTHRDLVISREPQLAFSSKIKISKELKDILTLILTKDPNLRISLAGIMQHDWVTKAGLEPLVPYKVQVARGSTVMSVTEDEVKAAIGVNEAGLAALCIVNPVEKQFEEGEYIIRQGEEGDEMYFINSGQCEVLVESRSLTQPSRGRMEYAVAERGPGQYIGEMALQKDETRKPPRRNASIRAKTRVVTLVVSREQVMDVLSKNAEAAQSMAETIAERDRELRMKLRALDLRMPSIRLEKEEDEAPPPKATCSACRSSEPLTFQPHFYDLSITGLASACTSAVMKLDLSATKAAVNITTDNGVQISVTM
ncbi:hypothetical protein AXG93_2931s1120 [Marchantia polymorpha subsp. ruderalis]|uniref:cGMP-dependent protein kinase n=1 Tax=Marchantia polymorpha subsp. ruderalis TaxID=1480154 RepID=A0A176VVP3_MARPO|nr:hypothetical protein AXG93_2931s1120 [Marchantia polymorpha subsp. ruderalis]